MQIYSKGNLVILVQTEMPHMSFNVLAFYSLRSTCAQTCTHKDIHRSRCSRLNVRGRGGRDRLWGRRVTAPRGCKHTHVDALRPESSSLILGLLALECPWKGTPGVSRGGRLCGWAPAEESPGGRGVTRLYLFSFAPCQSVSS